MAVIKRDIIVVGASAGGVEVLKRLVQDLPEGLPAIVLIVLHRLPKGQDLLAQILQSAGSLPVKDVVDWETPQHGHIYIAPPDRHLMIEKGMLRVIRGPKENHSRPAIDPLFRTAAREYGPRVAGVILSGTLFDGTAGLWAVKHYGGIALVQDPKETVFSGMVESALANVPVDYVLKVNEISQMLTRLVYGRPEKRTTEQGAKLVEPVTHGERVNTAMSGESTEFDELPDVVEANRAEQISGQRHGMTTVFTCPECGGTLWQANAGPVVQFRCHVGHSYTGEGLLHEQEETVEQALWYAIRVLIDKSVLLRQLAENAQDYGNVAVHDRYEQAAQVAEQHAATLKLVVQSPKGMDSGVNRENA